MRERATLRLDNGDELRVEVDPDDLDGEEIVVHRTGNRGAGELADRLAVIDKVLATADPHPAGTTDRLLEADRRRPY